MLANKRNLAQQLTIVVQSTFLSMPQQHNRDHQSSHLSYLPVWLFRHLTQKGQTEPKV